MSFRTQMVMTSGIQISRPVMRTFFMLRKQESPAHAGSEVFLASVFASVLVSVLVSVFVSDFRSAFFFSVGFLPVLLKSVAYQPLPFSWKPAAVSCFL